MARSSLRGLTSRGNNRSRRVVSRLTEWVHLLGINARVEVIKNVTVELIAMLGDVRLAHLRESLLAQAKMR